MTPQRARRRAHRAFNRLYLKPSVREYLRNLPQMAKASAQLGRMVTAEERGFRSGAFTRKASQ